MPVFLLALFIGLLFHFDDQASLVIHMYFEILFCQPRSGKL